MAREVTYRAEVVGSLLRPPEVKRAMEDAAAGKIDRDELDDIQDRAILDAIAPQEACGLDMITDGEYRRVNLLGPDNRHAGINVRFDDFMLRRLKELADRRNVGYQSLLKEFVVERLYEEKEKREGILPASRAGETGTPT